MKTIILTILTLILLHVATFAQISGTVSDQNGEKIPFANVVLLKNDTIFLSGTITDENGKYEFADTQNADLLKVSYIGYVDFSRDISANETVIDVVLESSDVNLDEITISARRQITQIKDGAMITNISGSPLSKLTDIQHVLNFVPGVVLQNETITVLGKGEPLVYINHRKIKDLSEVFMLSPDNIKNIKLISNPSAKYDSEVKSVLIINTINPTGEGFSIDNKLSIGHQYKFYFIDNLKVNYRNKQIDMFAAVNFSEKKINETVISTDETFLSSYYNMFTDDDNYFYTKPISSKFGVNYDFKSGNSIGFQYSNRLSNRDITSTTITNLRKDGILCENLNSTNIGSNKSGFHQANIYNSGSLLSWDYEIDLDAMSIFSDYNHLINEVSDDGEKIVLDCNDKNDASLYALKLEFCKEIIGGDLTIGTEHSFVDRNGVCVYLQNTDNNSDCHVKERKSAIYSEFCKTNDNWSFSLGLRYEHIRSDYFEYEIRQVENCRKYQNLFPSVSFDFSFGKTDLSISYDRSVQRPYYEQLGNNIGFISRYSYETGNPLLKPSYFDDFCINLGCGDFTFMADFFINHNYIYDSYTLYKNNEQISLIKPDNYKKFNSLQTSIAYNSTFGFYRPNLSASLYWQNMSIEFCKEKKTFDKPYEIIKFDNLFQLPKQIIFNFGLNYFAAGDDELGWIDNNFTCNFEISKTLGNWTVSLLCDDIFKTENQHFTLYGNIRKCTIEKHSDTRKIELTVHYKFNPTKSKYKGTGAGNDEKERM